MSQQKRKTSHPSIKQYFRGEHKQIFFAVSQPESENASSSDCKHSFDSVVQEEQHSTIRISKASSVLLNSQSAASNNNTFQSWIKLKCFDESLQMNVYILHADGVIILYVSYDISIQQLSPAEKIMVIFTLPSLPGLDA